MDIDFQLGRLNYLIFGKKRFEPIANEINKTLENCVKWVGKSSGYGNMK